MSILISRTCLFCLKTVNNLDVNAAESKQAIYFQRFFSFLGRLIRQTWKWRNSDFLKLLNWCEDCGKVVASFCTVYHQIRCLELELNWKLETLLNVMASKEESTIKCEGGGGSEEGSATAAAEDNLTKLHSKFRATRGHLMKQCSNYLSNLCPRIVIDSNGRTGVATFTSRKPYGQQSNSECHIPTTDDGDLQQTCFLGWTMSFVAVTLLFLLDSSTNSSSSNLLAPLIANVEVESALDHADCNDYEEDDHDNIGEAECEDDSFDQVRLEVDNGIENVATKATSNSDAALDVPQESTTTEELFIKQDHQRNVDEEGDNKSFEDVRTSALKLENLQEKNLYIDLSHGESLAPTQEQEDSAPIPLEENPHSNSDSSDTLLYKKRKMTRSYPRKVPSSLIATTVPAIEDDALEKVVQEQEDPAQLPSRVSRPRQLRNMHKCPLCKRTFSNLSNLESHQDLWHLDTDRSMISDEDDEDDECKFEVKRFKKEENGVDFDMEWKVDGSDSDSHVSSSSLYVAEADVEDTEFGAQREASETNLSQNESAEERGNVTTNASETQLRPKDDTNDNNTKAHVKPVKLRTKKRRVAAEKLKTFSLVGPRCQKKFPDKHAMIPHMNSPISRVEQLNFNITPEGLTIQEFALRKTGKFSCRVKLCGKKFRTQDDFNVHSKLHGNFTCSVCSTVKKFAPDLAIHEANHRRETVEKISRSEKKKVRHRVFNCARCAHKTSRSVSYIDHVLETHLGISNDKLRCTVCNAVFNVSTPQNMSDLVPQLYMHYTNHHGMTPGAPASTTVHKCDKCPAYFLTLIQLETHKEKEHSSGSKKNDKYTCSDCGKKFITRRHLRTHRKNVHKVEMRFSCPVEDCDKRFETWVDLDSHIRFQHGPGRTIVPCPICGKRMSQESIKAHQRTHDPTHYEKLVHKNKIVCDLCGKAFKNTDYLKIHLLSHSGPESWEFACETCGKKCISTQKLNEHQRIHTKEKPFVCDTCGQAYAHRHNLRIHVNNKHDTKDVARLYDKYGFNNYKKSSKRKKE